MAVVTVRVDDGLKKRMKRLKHVNWSEVLREAILRRLEQEEGRNLAKAVLLNNDLTKEPPKGWDSVEVIRYWRERRYGRSRG